MLGFTRFAFPAAPLVALLLFGCSSGYQPPTPEEMSIAVADSKRRLIDVDREQFSDALHSFLLGQLSLEREQPEKALQYLSRANELTSGGLESLAGVLSELYVRAGNLQQALSEVSRAAEESDDPGLRVLRAEILLALGREDEALSEYRRGIARFNKNPNLALGLTQVLLRVGAFDEAQQLLTDLVASGEISREFGFSLFLAHVLRDGETTIESTKKVTLQSADFVLPEQGVLVLAALDTEGERQTFESLRARFLAQFQHERRFEEYLAQFESTATDADGRREFVRDLARRCLAPVFARIRLGFEAFRGRAEGLSQVLFALAATQAEKSADPDQHEVRGLAQYLLASTLVAEGRRKEASAELHKVDKSDSLFVKARSFEALLEQQLNNGHKARTALREALAVQPENLTIRLYFVALLREQGRYGAALDEIHRGLEVRKDDDQLLFLKATVEHELGRDADSQETLRHLIAKKPGHLDAMNFLAYSLADQGKELDTALSLIGQVIHHRPNHAYYLDTLAWVHYKKGAFDDALKAIEAAVKLDDEDPVLLEHYGDILVSVGRSAEAVQHYRLALENALTAKDRDSKQTRIRLEKKLKVSNP